MSEQRKHPRAVPQQPVVVRDAISGRELGTLGNVSASGLMLITSEPIPEDRLLQLSFSVDDPEGARELTVGAESLWCSPATQPDRFWAGFEIVEISDEDRTFLASITT